MDVGREKGEEIGALLNFRIAPGWHVTSTSLRVRLVLRQSKIIEVNQQHFSRHQCKFAIVAATVCRVLRAVAVCCSYYRRFPRFGAMRPCEWSTEQPPLIDCLYSKGDSCKLSSDAQQELFLFPMQTSVWPRCPAFSPCRRDPLVTSARLGASCASLIQVKLVEFPVLPCSFN